MSARDCGLRRMPGVALLARLARMTVTGRVDAPQRSYAKPAGTTTVEVVRPVIEVAGLHKEYGATIAR